MAWVRAYHSCCGGIRVHSGHVDDYPEVTGYFIPTLLAVGEKDIALDCLRWLTCIQRGDGSFGDPDQGQPYVFDTGQVLRGLLAGGTIFADALDSARRAADYLCGQTVDDGRKGFGTRYTGDVPETVHLYVLPALCEAAEILGEPRYCEIAMRCLDYYVGHPDFLSRGVLTHFLAYQLEALIDLGRAELAKPVLDYLRGEQQSDGGVRGVGGVQWVCSPGLAQLAICWYKTGEWSAADRAVEWLESHQRPSGGFRGSYGRGASYMAKVEPSWAVKFYLDAHRLRVLSFIDRLAPKLPAGISETDGRMRAMLGLVKPGDRVLEVGCGRGRFLKVLQDRFPGNAYTGVDISRRLLSEVPDGIARVEGPMENLAIEDDAFDVVFSVEVLEHSVNPEAAVREMIRVAKPGGRIVVIDKQASHWGQMACPSWERWPESQKVKSLLSRGCDQVTCRDIGYDGINPDGLMVMWEGQKRSRLTGEEWNHVLISESRRERVLNQVRHHRVVPWGQEILLSTRVGQRVLEVGSGTGEISLQLAVAGRRVTVLDISQENLDFTRRCAETLGVSVETVCGDATEPFSSFAEGQFDCVWSSGLLEHFAPQERQAMLREWARVCRGSVITVVPNASAMGYRVGKSAMEAAGTWLYGHEMPIWTMREDFAAAGLRVAAEYSVGGRWGFEFLSPRHPLRIWSQSRTEAEFREMNQGYLLVTRGAVVR